MTQSQRTPLDCAWPLREQGRHFDLGCIINSAITDAISPAGVGELSSFHAGCWECDLDDQSLTWSGGVYDIFGLPRGVAISRGECLTFYSEESRVKLERLRAHSIRHNHGFTLDVEIRPAVGASRWMRIITAPMSTDGQVRRLHGVKLIV